MFACACACAGRETRGERRKREKEKNRGGELLAPYSVTKFKAASSATKAKRAALVARIHFSAGFKSK